jgi:hypothetical protein
MDTDQSGNEGAPMSHRRFLALTVAAVAVASACTSVPRNDSGGLSEAAAIPVAEFQIGDCFDDPTVIEVEDVPGLPCDLAHDNEVYAIFEHEEPDQAWPGQDALNEYAYLACVDRFAAYVGAEYADSRLDLSFFKPLEDGWNNDDYEIVCFLFDRDFAKLTASMRDSGE